MKHLFTTAAVLFSMTAFAQVGINNTSPKATLDITAKTTDGSKPEGLIIPQLSGSNIHTATAAGIYGPNQKGLIIYATSADSSPISTTANITAAGYYYFDGTNWQKITGTSAADATTTSKGIVQLAGDLAGTAASPTVAKIQSKAVSSTAPTNGQVLKYNTGTSSWEPAADTDTNTTYTAGSGMTLTGTSFSANDATTLAKGIVQLAGDLAGTATSPTVAKIQSKAVSSTAPTNGQVLKYNTGTSAWEPAADTDTNTTYTGSTSINLNGTSFERTALTGDVTASANSNTTTIAANAVTSAKIADGTVANGDLANMAALTVKGNATNASASPTDITAGTDGYVLRRSGTTLGFGTVDNAGITDGAVTTNKILNGTVANIDLDTGVGGIYKGSGALSGNTTVAQGGSTLAFTSTATNGFSVDGNTLSVDAANNRVGIGTSSPGNLLEISSSSSNTGLKLPYGAAAGKILTSDASGNSSWQTTNSVFIYSEVHSTGNSTSFPAGSIVNFFHTIKGENVKTIYGNSYGWIDGTQRWVAPYTGKYRVTTNMYFNSTSSANPRIYAYINGTTVCNITSSTNSGTDGTAYTSAIVTLNQGEYIQWKAATSTVLFGWDYHTFIRVESVE